MLRTSPLPPLQRARGRPEQTRRCSPSLFGEGAGGEVLFLLHHFHALPVGGDALGNKAGAPFHI